MKIRSIIDKTKKFFNRDLETKKQLVEDKDIKAIEEKLKEIEKKQNIKIPKVVSNFNNKTFFRFWIIGLLVVFLGYMTFQSLEVFYLIISAYIISIAMEAIILFFSKKMPRGLAIGISYILLIVFLLSSFFFILPFFLSQTTEMFNMFISWAKELQKTLETRSLQSIIEDLHWLPNYFKKELLTSIDDPTLFAQIQGQLQKNISQIIGTGTEYVKSFGILAVNFVSQFFSFLTKTAIVITLSVLFSIEKKAVIFFIAKIGGKRGNYLQIKLERLYNKLGLRLKGQMLLCVFIALAVAIALFIMSAFGMEIPQKGSLIMIAGLTEIIPYIGPLLGSIPIILVALLYNGIYGALIVIAVFFGIQRLENNVLIPIVMNKTLGVNPVTIFISMLLGGLIMGFIGVLLAVPIAVILTMIFDDDY